ncbi:hypothetical protein [Amycolatopsis sp. NPDC049868]|uniref:hypothetical protein n=1 Tax=Amycolatopsis sp. NPDC049868 TaxID=3363934 RepID=UPI00379D3470
MSITSTSISPIAPWTSIRPIEGRFPAGRLESDGFVGMITSAGLIHEYQQVA